jgi:hypothetical protein
MNYQLGSAMTSIERFQLWPARVDDGSHVSAIHQNSLKHVVGWSSFDRHWQEENDEEIFAPQYVTLWLWITRS